MAPERGRIRRAPLVWSATPDSALGRLSPAYALGFESDCLPGGTPPRILACPPASTGRRGQIMPEAPDVRSTTRRPEPNPGRRRRRPARAFDVLPGRRNHPPRPRRGGNPAAAAGDDRG